MKKYNLYKPSHPVDVLQFCCDKALPNIKSSEIEGFTEHHRRDEITKQKFIFRSNPAYRSDSGQVCDVWYDWASFDYKERGMMKKDYLHRFFDF